MWCIPYRTERVRFFTRALQVNKAVGLLGHSWGQLDASYYVYPHLAIYFGSPFGRYPTFHTLTSVTRKYLFSMLKDATVFLCCSKVL